MAVRSYVVRIFVTKFQEKFVVQTKPQVSLNTTMKATDGPTRNIVPATKYRYAVDQTEF